MVEVGAPRVLLFCSIIAYFLYPNTCLQNRGMYVSNVTVEALKHFIQIISRSLLLYACDTEISILVFLKTKGCISML